MSKPKYDTTVARKAKAERIVANAWQMFDALKMLIAHSECSINDTPIWNHARKIVAEIEGAEPQDETA